MKSWKLESCLCHVSELNVGISMQIQHFLPSSRSFLHTRPSLDRLSWQKAIWLPWLNFSHLLLLWHNYGLSFPNTWTEKCCQVMQKKKVLCNFHNMAMLMQSAAGALHGVCRIKPKARKLSQEWAALWEFKSFTSPWSKRVLSPVPFLMHCRLSCMCIQEVFRLKAPCFQNLRPIFFYSNFSFLLHFWCFWFPHISHLFLFHFHCHC